MRAVFVSGLATPHGFGWVLESPRSASGRGVQQGPPFAPVPGVVRACPSTIRKRSGLAGPDSGGRRGEEVQATPGTLTVTACRAARRLVAAPPSAGMLNVAWAWPGWYVPLTQAARPSAPDSGRCCCLREWGWSWALRQRASNACILIDLLIERAGQQGALPPQPSPAWGGPGEPR